MHRQSEYSAAEKAAIELMTKISISTDSINDSEKIIAQKVSSDDFLGFNSLGIDEIDDLINLVGNYWDDEDNITIAFVDMLLKRRYSLENKM